MSLFAIAAVICLFSVTTSTRTPGFDPNDVVRRVHNSRRPVGAAHQELDDDEFLVDTCPVYSAAEGWQENPAVAFDGENFLVVWQDTRSAYWSDIHGARVRPDGTLLDPAGFLIATADREQELPAVAFGGSVFLVAWQDRRNGFYRDIYAARVTQQGTVLDTSSIAVSTETEDQLFPAVAFDGDNFLVAWGDGRTGSFDLRGTRITTEGIVLDPAGITISTAIRGQMEPALAFDGNNYLAVWVDTRSGVNADIYGARVTPEAIVLDPEGIPVCTTSIPQHHPAVAFDGTNFLVAWTEYRGESAYDIYCGRVTLEGAVLDPSGIAVSTADGWQRNPAVVWDGANSLVVWDDGRSVSGVYGARVTPAGVVLDTTGIRVSRRGGLVRGPPAAAFEGGNHLVAWTYGSSHRDVRAVRITPEGTVLDSSDIVLSTAANTQLSPAVAADSSNFLVVWEDERDVPSADIYALRVSPTGVLLDSSGIAIATADNRQAAPAAAFDGTNYLVAWQDARSGHYDIWGARLNPAGTLLDSHGFVISSATSSQESPAIAFDGDNFLVIWQDDRDVWPETDIYCARVSPGGTVLDPQGIQVTGARGAQLAPAIVFDGANSLVAWADERNGYSNIYCARVSRSGVVLDTAGICVSGEEWWWAGTPAVASDGGASFVTWSDEREFVCGIYGARVARSGMVLDSLGIAITADSNYHFSPAVCFDGGWYLVFWHDWPDDPDTGISGARVAVDGTVIERFPVVVQEGCQQSPAVTIGAANQTFLAYEGWTADVGGKAYDTDRIWAKLGPFTGVREGMETELFRRRPVATILRGTVHLPSMSSGSLLDISGRKVMDLQPGENDVRHLASGVYFVRPASSVEHQASSVRKVVVQR